MMAKPTTKILILNDDGFRGRTCNQKCRNFYFYNDCESITKYALSEGESFEWRNDMHDKMIDKWLPKKLTLLQRILP